jgi:hypothetical protein
LPACSPEPAAGAGPSIIPGSVRCRLSAVVGRNSLKPRENLRSLPVHRLAPALIRFAIVGDASQVRNQLAERKAQSPFLPLTFCLVDLLLESFGQDKRGRQSTMHLDGPSVGKSREEPGCRTCKRLAGASLRHTSSSWEKRLPCSRDLRNHENHQVSIKLHQPVDNLSHPPA